MKFYDMGLTILLILIVSTALGILSVKFLGKENPIEEAAEEIIELETGKKVEFSDGEENAANQVKK